MHNSLQCQRDAGRQRRNGQRVFVKNGVHRFHRGRFLERPFSRQHLVENRAEGKNIGTMIGYLSTDLLRRHVAHRAHHYASLSFHRYGGHPAVHGRLALRELRQAKIENLDPSVSCREKVLGFQITVHDSLFMCCRQAVCDLHAVVDRFARGKCSAFDLRA